MTLRSLAIFAHPVELMRLVYVRKVRPLWWDLWRRRRVERMSDGAFVASCGFSGAVPEFLRSFNENARFRFFFHPRNRKDFFLNTLEWTQPYESIVADGDAVLANRFQALGSDVVSLGDPIPWHRDFKCGVEWPLKPSRSIDLLGIGRPSDVKVPWELSRFHQVWWLGKAYWLTGNERYATKFRAMVEDWLERNPPGLGVNWGVAMEAAIRACNLIAGYYFFCESSSFTPEFEMRLLKSLRIHGDFLWHHLERARINGNHFLSDVVGLIFIGTFFQHTSFGSRWLAWGVKTIGREMDFQVSADGVDFEKSTSYQRLVAELFLSATLLLRVNGKKLSDAFMKRLERMLEYIQAYTRPDGSVPCIGDADDGRLFRFSVNEDPNDHRHVLSVGAILFGRSDFASSAGKFLPDALWYFGGEGFERFRMLGGTPELRSQAFPDGGMFVMRGKDVHVVVDAGEIGQRGRGGHGHNDTLSFEYWARGESVIVDSGTYAYTSDVAARNALRSTVAHNTVMVDGREISEFTGLWTIREDRTRPKVLRWDSSDDTDVLEAEHHAYEILENPLVHRRRWSLQKSVSCLTIDDGLEGSGEHSIESFLHFAPGFEIALRDERTAVASVGSEEYIVTSDAGTWSVRETWYSPRYGVRQRNKTLVLTLTGPAPLGWRTVIQPE